MYNSAGKLVAGVSTSGPAITMTDEKLMELSLIHISMCIRDRGSSCRGRPDEMPHMASSSS